MGETSIEWTSYKRPNGTIVPGYTFNPWMGCQKVSEACRHCYAEHETPVRVQRGKGIELWGLNAQRKVTSDAYWRQPVKWDREAEEMGERRRVFCASLADVFEDHPAIKPGTRARLGRLILDTPHLDWLLLTKRPENVLRLAPDFWIYLGGVIGALPPNVWIGTTVENQAMADKRIPELLKIPARVRFLSAEPMLGPIDLRRAVPCGYYCDETRGHIDHTLSGIHGVIVGGESGSTARPMHPEWPRLLRDECVRAGVPYFFKQWGEWLPYERYVDAPFYQTPDGFLHDGHGLNILDPYTGGDGKGWDSGLWCIEQKLSDCAFRKVGKKAAGRLLDGRTWDEMPEVA